MEDSTPDARSFDDVLQLLADGRRRQVLRQIRDRGGRIDRRELATDLVSDDADRAVPSPADSEATVIESELHHVHLPKLAQMGVIEYDRSTGTVTYENDDVIDEVLQLLESKESEDA